MTTPSRHFDTAIEGLSGLRPEVPALWSYSSLATLEACPRRWMLERADYPALWDRRGYPVVPIRAAVFGSVAHLIIERLSHAMGTTDDAVAPLNTVDVLRALGGWAQVAEAAVDEALADFDDNPRVSQAALDRLRDDLVRRVPDAVDQVKLLLRDQPSIKTGVRPAPAADSALREAPRGPATPGTHVERTVTVEDLRLSGRLDLLSIDEADVTITDFKTGAEREEHDDQVRLYALLWRFDAFTNPMGRPATKLSIAYSSHERAVPAPDVQEMLALHASTGARIAAADATVMSASPAALPSPEACQFCQVKHLCDAYWASVPPPIASAPLDEWFDTEGRVSRRNGSRSWVFETLDQPTFEVLVRTLETDVAFPVGRRVRLLGVRRSVDPDAPERLVISLSTASKWYPLRA